MDKRQTQWSLDGVSPYLEKLEEIYNTLTSGHYQLHLETEDEYNKSIQQKNDLMPVSYTHLLLAIYLMNQLQKI